MPLRFKVCHMRNHRGFTLIELMVTISVAAIIMAIAVPSMQLMQANARMASTANDLASDLKKARSNAISYRTNYTFLANSGSWNSGWEAKYQIATGSSKEDVVNDKTLLHKVALPAGITISQTATTLLFNGTTGVITDAAGLPLDATFVVCDNKVSGESGYSVALNRFGRVLIQRHASSTICSI